MRNLVREYNVFKSSSKHSEFSMDVKKDLIQSLRNYEPSFVSDKKKKFVKLSNSEHVYFKLEKNISLNRSQKRKNRAKRFEDNIKKKLIPFEPKNIIEPKFEMPSNTVNVNKIN